MTSSQDTTATQDAPEAAAPPTFDLLPLTPEVRRALQEMGFVTPTPVQLAAYGPAVAGKDLVVQAQTGTGKTAGFGLPLVDHHVTQEPTFQALILAPTRELALQSAREIARIGVHRNIQTAAIYGGAPFEKQVQAIEAGAQIVSGTPGRVLDHLRRGTLNPATLKVLVLDEADEMLSMGFAKELHAIFELLPKSRQTLLFSATVEDSIKAMAERRLKDPEFITLSSDRVGASSISHFVYFVTGGGRAQDLIRILEIEDPETAIIFCNTKAETEQAAGALQQAGFNADWLNGDLPQSERERIMARTRSSELRYLVATDVAARGIDISHLTHVINYTFPVDIPQYIHRTGRTGRAGKTGTAISMVSPQEIGSLYYLRLQYKVFPVERSLPSKGEERTRKEADRIAMMDAAFRTAPSEFDRAVTERLMTHPDADRIIGGLVSSFFGGKGDGVDEEAAAARRSRRPAPVDEPRAERSSSDRGGNDREPRRSRERSDRDAPRERAPRPEREPRREREPRPDRPVGDRPPRRERPAGDRQLAIDVDRRNVNDTIPGEPAPMDNDGEPSRPMVRLYVNVGRRDGLRAGDLAKLLREKAGLEPDDIGRIRVRDRHTFVEVTPTRADDSVTKLAGAELAGAALVVEVARASRGDAAEGADSEHP